MPLLEVRNLQVHYGKIHALRGVSLSLGKDQIVALIGANGAGKSTMLRAISGILAMTGGDVVLEGESLKELPAHRIVAKGIVQVPEGRRIFGRLTVRKTCALARSCTTTSGGSPRWRRGRSTCSRRSRSGWPRWQAPCRGGEQQMLAIARGLMANPRVLLLDEPSMGLAPILVQKIFDTIVEIRKQGVPVLLVEQNAFPSLQIADYGYVIETGEVVLEAPAPSCLPIRRSRRRTLASGAALARGVAAMHAAGIRRVAVPGLARRTCLSAMWWWTAPMRSCRGSWRAIVPGGAAAHGDIAREAEIVMVAIRDALARIGLGMERIVRVECI